MKKIVILAAVFIIISIFFLIINNKNMDQEKNSNDTLVTALNTQVSSDRGPVTEEELNRGFYYHSDKDTKAENTPENWVYLHNGTKSAMWQNPENLERYQEEKIPTEKNISLEEKTKEPESPQLQNPEKIELPSDEHIVDEENNIVNFTSIIKGVDRGCDIDGICFYLLEEEKRLEFNPGETEEEYWEGEIIGNLAIDTKVEIQAIKYDNYFYSLVTTGGEKLAKKLYIRVIDGGEKI